MIHLADGCLDTDTSSVALIRPLVPRLGLGELRGKLRVPRVPGVPDHTAVNARFAVYGVWQLRVISEGNTRSAELNAMPP